MTSNQQNHQHKRAHARAEVSDQKANNRFLFLFFLIILTWTSIIVTIGYIYSRYQHKIDTAIAFDPGLFSEKVIQQNYNNKEELINLRQKVDLLESKISEIKAISELNVRYIESSLPPSLPGGKPSQLSQAGITKKRGLNKKW